MLGEPVRALPKDCRQTNPPLDDTPPRVVSRPTTSATPTGTNIKGVCMVSVTVEPDGRTSHIRVRKGLDWDLDQEAIHAVKQRKFKRPTPKGKPIAAQIAV